MQVVDEDVGVGVLGVVLEEGRHGVVVLVVAAVVALGSRGVVGRGGLFGALPGGVEPEVVAVCKVHVTDVVHFVNGD